jgi:tetratricopeptide (TPR) repeat protein/predicted aspartyl protease
MGRNLCWLGLAAAAVGLPAMAAPAKCNLMKVADLPVAMRGSEPIAEVKINGRPVRLIVDTGAFFSTLDVDAFDKFDLKRTQSGFGQQVRGVGGSEQMATGRAATFELGGYKLENYEFVVVSRFGAADGLLGENILGGLDSEYDFANGDVRLFRTENCSKSNLAYWAADKAVTTVPLLHLGENEHGQPIGKAKVNGREIRVMFDTGAERSVLKRSTAEKLGFSPTGEGVTDGGSGSGIGRKIKETWIAPFASFAIGGEEIKNTKLRVSDFDLPGVDMLLGADFFLSHRVYVARSQNQILITYNGGPVFSLERIGGRPGQAPVAVAAPGSGALGELKTADEYVRRGKASVSRRDYAAAIADFSKAIDLEPNDAAHYYDRGSAHVAARQPVLALSDLDKTLALKPDQLDALLMRGELFLQRGQIPRARADFAAADKAAGSDGEAHLHIAADYVRAGLTQEAINEYNDWFAAHPDRRNDAGVLNSRCFARALSGRELELALADCNASIKVSDNASFLDSRGLTYLRMGQYDKAIADYDASLKKQPRSAWPLYGRGLAKVKKGLDAEGKADIRDAMNIGPGVVVVASRYGLSPPPGTVNPAPSGLSPVNP